MQFYISKFPKFKLEFLYDDCKTWGESLRNNGYPSVYLIRYDDDELFEMDDTEYTWFVLRWS